MYEIKTEDIFEDFSNNKEMFDFSNYSVKSKFYDGSNKWVIGKMKDETAGIAIEEFVGLRPNRYSYLVNDHSEHKKVKGVNKNVVATISHNEYNVWDIRWIGFKVNIIKQELKKSTRFLCLASMIK